MPDLATGSSISRQQKVLKTLRVKNCTCQHLWEFEEKIAAVLAARLIWSAKGGHDILDLYEGTPAGRCLAPTPTGVSWQPGVETPPRR